MTETKHYAKHSIHVESTESNSTMTKRKVSRLTISSLASFHKTELWQKHFHFNMTPNQISETKQQQKKTISNSIFINEFQK